MRVRVGNGVVPLNLLVWLLIATILFFPSNVLSIILGVPFVVFFPGYALTAALFPKRGGMAATERVALSFGASIAVVPLIGLILNWTPWGISLESILSSIASFTFIISVLAWYRWRRLPVSERLSIEFRMRIQDWGGSVWSKALSAILKLAILGVFTTVVYVIAVPKTGEPFTEFYVLGLEGSTRDYPKTVAVHTEGLVIVGIGNNEYGTVSYRVEVTIDNELNNEIGPIVVDNEGTWEGEVAFIPQTVGEHQRVEFVLYADGQAEPLFEPIRLWIDVEE